MEDNISNPLRFETNPYHNVIIKDRKVMELTGAGFTIHHWESYISVNTQGAVFYYWALQ